MNGRRHKRFPIAATAMLTFKGEEDVRSTPTFTVDISLSGIGVYSDGPIKENADLSIAIHFISFDGSMRTASLEGRSVYAREVGNMYFVGIEFDEEIGPTKQPALYDHLRRSLYSDQEPPSVSLM